MAANGSLTEVLRVNRRELRISSSLPELKTHTKSIVWLLHRTNVLTLDIPQTTIKISLSELMALEQSDDSLLYHCHDCIHKT